MRATLLYAIIIMFVPFALTRPRWGLYAYLFFSLARPDYMAFAAGDRMSFVLAAATLVGTLAVLDSWFAQLRNPFVLLLLILLAFSGVSAALAQFTDLALPRYFQFVRASLLAIAIPVLVRTVDDLRHAMMAIVAGASFVAVKMGSYGLLHGGVRYAQGYGGMINDNNTMALALVMAVPVAYYGISMVSARWRAGLIGSVFFLMTTVIMTFSRGAALSFVVSMLGIIRHSKRKAIVVVAIVMLGVPALLLVGPSYFDRIETVSDYSADNSAQSRLNNLGIAVTFWRDYPIHGAGFGMLNQQLLWSNYVRRGGISFGLVIHNTYFQWLTDSGLFGFIPYMILLFGSIWWLGKSAKRMRKSGNGLQIYPLAIQSGLVTFAVGSFFLSRTDFDITYMLVMCAAAWWKLCRTGVTATQTAPALETVKLRIPLRRGAGSAPAVPVAR